MRSRVSKDDVQKLSRGMPTRSKIGGRSTGHRLTLKERALFEAAKRQGFLKIPVGGLRENVRNVYRKWCEAADIACEIREVASVDPSPNDVRQDGSE